MVCFFNRLGYCECEYFWFILSSGLRSESLTNYAWSLVVLLHSFPSFASRPICLSPARDIGDLRYTGVVVLSLVGYIGHMLVAMSLYAWITVMT
jgi:hypothetical protein